MNTLAHSGIGPVTNPSGFISRVLPVLLCAIFFPGCAMFQSGPDGLEVSPDSFRHLALSAYQSAASKLAGQGYPSKLGDDPDISVTIRQDGVMQGGHKKVQMSTGEWAGGWSTITRITVVEDVKESYTWGMLEHEWGEIILHGHGLKSTKQTHPVMKRAGIYGG
jgi:hypothetical protein